MAGSDALVGQQQLAAARRAQHPAATRHHQHHACPAAGDDTELPAVAEERWSAGQGACAFEIHVGAGA